MKSIQEILGDTKPKSIEKLNKAFESSGFGQYKDSFIAEALSAGAKDFPNIKCIVTDTYLCCYFGLVSAFGKSVFVVPLSGIKSVYRSNINNEPKYDYDNFYLGVEFNNGNRCSVATLLRHSKNVLHAYDDIIAYVNSKKALVEG